MSNATVTRTSAANTSQQEPERQAMEAVFGVIRQLHAASYSDDLATSDASALGQLGALAHLQTVLEGGVTDERENELASQLAAGGAWAHGYGLAITATKAQTPSPYGWDLLFTAKEWSAA